MRVGITTELRFSMFSSGHANSCLSVASIFQAMGHEVILLHKQVGQTWWDDLNELAADKPKCVLLDDFLKLQTPLDLVIEVSYNMSPIVRSKVAKRVVWYNRKPGLFTDIEATVYGCRPDGRSLEGISAIWTADIFTRSDDLVYLQTLYPKIPIYTVPWTWTPEIVEAHRTAMKAPVWSQIYQVVPSETKWSIHIAESNMSSTSSCTLPLVIMRNTCLNKQMPISQIIVHNTELLKENQFFKENILLHCNLPDIPFQFFGRQRIIDWINDPKSIVLSHNRFVPVKMGNIEAVWVGIPLIHNSTVLRDMGCGLELLYYDGNSVTGATEALNRVIYNTETIPYLLNLEKLGELRKKILEAFYPLTHVQGWAVAVERTMNMALVPSNPLAPVAPLAPLAPLAPVLPKVQTESTFRVLFTDMWDQFNPEHNMFILALQTALNILVSGYSLDTMPQTGRIDLAIFGPFGEDWKRLPEALPKVHFTGENTEPINHSSVKLNIGYALPAMSDDRYLRMPLWHLEIDWFGANLNQIRNPLPLPIHTCTSVVKAAEKRSKFCAFVVTNPKNPVRNQAFHTLNKYKAVDSAGRLYNTMGDQIFAGLGGGGGELKKHEFLQNYRFCIAYENASAPGYTTEKLLHAKAAGCIPIYWGDPKVARDFNEKGFINANSCKTAEDLVALVDTVERDETLMAAMRSVPALTSYQRDLVRRNFAEMVRRFVAIAGRTELLPGLPKFIGAKTTEEAEAMRFARLTTCTTVKSTLFLTGVTQKFWHCLPRWIESVQGRGSVKVYVGDDVPQSNLDLAKTQYKTTEFIPFPTKMIPNIEFKDFWTPSHYAWKLFLLEKTVTDQALKDRLVFYMDVGSVLVNEPKEWMQHARIHGVSLLNDVRQKNRNWCHEIFCRSLSVTDFEKESQQIAACLIMFVAGHPTAVQLLNQSLVLGTHREIIVGEKWAGIGHDGKPFGHRHDQSILSIVSQRLNIHRVPIDTVYCDVSRKTTLDLGRAVYVHRGGFKESEGFLPGIDQAHVINLDRRKDRMESFMSRESHVYLHGRVKRLAAHDGRTLQLTPELRTLFKPNDFFWKKAVMGCAMSHLRLWTELANGPDQAYLILEDDARLEPEWMEAWLKAYPSLPTDWDCVYLGGILPPNRTTFNTTLERVADGLARVAMNKIFGQPVPTRYFHFCAYAYVLSKAGARKILDSIKEKGGYWTSADHMICNRVDTMNLYVINPLVAGASQDSDPAYQTAQFNNFSRIDNFDSDLWNNDERFTADEISGLQAPVKTHEGPRFICLNTSMENGSKLYEVNWLQDIFQITRFNVESVSATETLSKTENLIIVLIRPQWAEQLAWLELLRSTGYRFKILHLSDEFATDPIHMYSWPEVTGVIRFYNRPNLPSKVLVIPLGYHRQFRGNRDVPHMSTPNLPFRDNMWSFVGTDWKDRSKNMEILNVIQPSYVRWFSEWRDPAQLKDDEYVALLLNTKCVPCPRGQNVETYRFYEALECGCIPLIVHMPENEEWLQLFNNELPLIKLEGWAHVAALMQHFQKNPEQMEQYRMSLLVAWAKYKAGLKERVRTWLEHKKIDA